MARRKRRNPILTGIVIIGICVIVGAGGFFGYMQMMTKPIISSNGNSDTIVVSIPSGTGTGGIAAILKENGLIRSESAFKLQTKLKGYDGKYKAGQYQLNGNMDMLTMMEDIASGKTASLQVTIPEGYTIYKIEERLTGKELINKEQFQWEIENGKFDYEFLKDAPAGPKRLEGYLFPETYDFFSLSDEHAMIDRMLLQFDQVFTDEYRAKAKELGLSINEVMTVASIIQGEAARTDEMKTISSVIYNRLKVNMRLQMDSTVQYVLEERTDRVSISNTKVDSPYNTYVNKGLPPGPICSPGAKAIEAALYPEKTDYIYFVAKGDGYHAFSKDYDTFLKNKKKYIETTFGE